MTGRLVALIVDNPLRDLDGMVLLAAALASEGASAVLVPMYEQGFDIRALRPDAVVVNYIRANNRDHLVAYKALGSRIIVLDSEGAAGRTPEDYARMVAGMEPAALVDDYCVWGRARYGALAASKALPAERIHLTGCPRYDFCAPPWSSALPPTGMPAGFILVNTNFPLPNPRFAASADEERRTLERVWKDPEYVDAVNRDARTAFAGMLEAIERLARRFRDRRIVVRPHPFEAVAPYRALEASGNLEVRQEGTSLQWIREAALLVHQNCSTAVEAVMLGREPVSLEWLSSEALRLPGPSAVSIPAASQAELERIVERLASGDGPTPAPALASQRREVIESLFFANDGKAAQRVAQVVKASLERPAECSRKRRRSVRSVAVGAARRVLGHEGFGLLQRLTRGSGEERRRAAKALSLEAVNAILARVCEAGGFGAGLRAVRASEALDMRARAFSGNSLHIGRRGP